MANPWYHCGRCGSLFEAVIGHSENRLCGVCGQRPGTGIRPAPSVQKEVEERNAYVFEKKGDFVDEGDQRTVRKKRQNNIMLRVVIVWSLIMGVSIWLHRTLSREDSEKNGSVGKVDMAKGTMADERIALLSRALPQCHKALAGFLTSGAPEARNQYVADPIGTAGKMAIFYRSNPFPNVDPGTIRRVAQEPIKVGEEWMIETRWKDEGNGAEFDAVFRLDAGVWKLDWNHFSRYGDYPWALFLAGEGPDEAEFRLLARLVSGGDKAERDGSRLRVILLSSEFGKPSGAGTASPEFIVSRSSDEGLLLGAAFVANHEGKHLFGSSLKPMEPDGLVRVRVQLKRGQSGGERSFEIARVVACHWISSDQQGFDLKVLQEDIFGDD